MPNYIRTHTPGATYFFTVNLQDRGARFLVDHVADLRQCVKEVRERHPFAIDAMVVLPEHLHAVWTLPQDDGDFSKRWMLVKQSFTRRLQDAGVVPQQQGKAARVWQKRFWEHQIRDDEDLRRHIEYIHFNPVKHGWVMRAREWPYSSLHRYIREGSLHPDWGISAAITGAFGE